MAAREALWPLAPRISVGPPLVALSVHQIAGSPGGLLPPPLALLGPILSPGLLRGLPPPVLDPAPGPRLVPDGRDWAVLRPLRALVPARGPRPPFGSSSGPGSPGIAVCAGPPRSAAGLSPGGRDWALVLPLPALVPVRGPPPPFGSSSGPGSPETALCAGPPRPAPGPGLLLDVRDWALLLLLPALVPVRGPRPPFGSSSGPGSPGTALCAGPPHSVGPAWVDSL